MKRSIGSRFDAEFAARTARLVASGWPDAFTERRVIVDWAREPSAPRPIIDASALAVDLNATIATVAASSWPPASELGFAGAFAAAALFAHADDDVALRDHALPLFKEAVLAGEADPRHFAHVHDRHRAERDGLQTYGSLIVPTPGGDAEYVCPIADVADAEHLRKVIGLSSLAAARAAWTRGVKPGPFLMPYRTRDFILLAVRLGAARLTTGHR